MSRMPAHSPNRLPSVLQLSPVFERSLLALRSGSVKSMRIPHHRSCVGRAVYHLGSPSSRYCPPSKTPIRWPSPIYPLVSLLSVLHIQTPPSQLHSVQWHQFVANTEGCFFPPYRFLPIVPISLVYPLFRHTRPASSSPTHRGLSPFLTRGSSSLFLHMFPIKNETHAM